MVLEKVDHQPVSEDQAVRFRGKISNRIERHLPWINRCWLCGVGAQERHEQDKQQHATSYQVSLSRRRCLTIPLRKDCGAWLEGASCRGAIRCQGERGCECSVFSLVGSDRRFPNAYRHGAPSGGRGQL